MTRWNDAPTARKVLLSDVRVAVKSAGLSNLALAKKLGVSPQYVCDLLAGRRKLSPKIVNAIGEAVSAHPVRWGRWQKWGAQSSGWTLA